MLAEQLLGGAVLLIFGVFLGYVLDSRRNRQLELDMAKVAASLPALQVAVDSVSVALRGHLASEGHPVTNQRLNHLERQIEGMRRRED